MAHYYSEDGVKNADELLAALTVVEQAFGDWPHIAECREKIKRQVALIKHYANDIKTIIDMAFAVASVIPMMDLIDEVSVDGCDWCLYWNDIQWVWHSDDYDRDLTLDESEYSAALFAQDFPKVLDELHRVTKGYSDTVSTRLKAIKDAL